jgi:hypothetical protein
MHYDRYAGKRSILRTTEFFTVKKSQPVDWKERYLCSGCILERFQQAVRIAYEEEFFPEMSGGVPFSWYCETEIGIDERELAGYLKNKHPRDSEAAFSEYLNLILGFIMHSKDFIHKFRKTGNRKSFLRSVNRWIKENPEVPLEHIILREETKQNNGETQYIGFVTNERLQSDNSFENGLIAETMRILGKMV